MMICMCFMSLLVLLSIYFSLLLGMKKWLYNYDY